MFECEHSLSWIWHNTFVKIKTKIYFHYHHLISIIKDFVQAKCINHSWITFSLADSRYLTPSEAKIIFKSFLPAIAISSVKLPSGFITKKQQRLCQCARSFDMTWKPDWDPNRLKPYQLDSFSITWWTFHLYINIFGLKPTMNSLLFKYFH